MTCKLPIIFRTQSHGQFKGEVTACFPSLPGTNDSRTFLCYSHVGQHGSASLPWYRDTRPAKPSEYADLLAELRGIYENPHYGEPVELTVYHRITRQHHQARTQELAA